MIRFNDSDGRYLGKSIHNAEKSRQLLRLFERRAELCEVDVFCTVMSDTWYVGVGFSPEGKDVLDDAERAKLLRWIDDTLRVAHVTGIIEILPERIQWNFGVGYKGDSFTVSTTFDQAFKYEMPLHDGSEDMYDSWTTLNVSLVNTTRKDCRIEAVQETVTRTVYKSICDGEDDAVVQ